LTCLRFSTPGPAPGVNNSATTTTLQGRFDQLVFDPWLGVRRINMSINFTTPLPATFQVRTLGMMGKGVQTGGGKEQQIVGQHGL
jgi:hypothetical protein